MAENALLTTPVSELKKLLLARAVSSEEITKAYLEQIAAENALKKVSIAAKKFDPAHPASPSLDAFEGRFMTIATFREIMKPFVFCIIIHDQLVVVFKR